MCVCVYHFVVFFCYVMGMGVAVHVAFGLMQGVCLCFFVIFV